MQYNCSSGLKILVQLPIIELFNIDQFIWTISWNRNLFRHELKFYGHAWTNSSTQNPKKTLDCAINFKNTHKFPKPFKFSIYLFKLLPLCMNLGGGSIKQFFGGANCLRGPIVCGGQLSVGTNCLWGLFVQGAVCLLGLYVQGAVCLSGLYV